METTTRLFDDATMIERIFDHIDHETTDLGEATWREPVENYRSEARYAAERDAWMLEETGYQWIQGTRPQTLAYGLTDSPVGLAGWIVEKFRAWSDCDGEVEKSYTKDELLTNLMIYWVTGTISSSARLYLEDAFQSAPQLAAGQYIEVPAGVATFPKDLTYPPRELGERFLRVAHWTEMPRGGHFAALEEPELYAKDVQDFVRELRG